MTDRLLAHLGRDYVRGTVLFREGDVGHEMYVIHSGRVRLSRQLKDAEVVLADLPPGEFFGEMAIVNHRPRSATAQVVEDARLLVIDAKTFAAMVKDKAEIALRMIKTLAARLEQANYQIELLLLKDGNHRVTQCLRRMAEQQGQSAHTAAGVLIPVTVPILASRVALDEAQVADVLARLHDARLITTAREVGYAEDGFVVPEVGRLVEFLEFLEMKERFSGG